MGYIGSQGSRGQVTVLNCQKQGDHSYCNEQHRKSNVHNGLTCNGQHRQNKFYGGITGKNFDTD